MEKKVLSVFLAGAMAVGMLAGCGSSSSGNNAADNSQAAAGSESGGAAAADSGSGESATGSDSSGAIALDGSWPEETVKIGVEVYDTTDTTVIAYMEYFEYLEDYFNVEFMFSESISNAEEELAFADSCASAGCVAYIGGYNASMETIVDKVTEYGMYYWGCERGLDEAYADNEYYLGGFSPVSTDSSIDASKGGDYLIGYSMATKLADQGAKHVVYCSGGDQMGIQMFIDRLEGFKDGIAAAQANGSDIVWDEKEDSIAGWPGTDDFAAAQSNAVSKDYDAVACSFSGFEVWAQPLSDAGKTDVKIAGVGGVDGSLSDLFEQGTISMDIYECPEIVTGQAFPMIMNAVTGHADVVKGDTGYLACQIERWVIEDADTYNAIYDFHEEGNYYVSAQDLTEILCDFTEGVTQEDINNFYLSKTMDACMN